jgi:hypothetical protein
VAEDQDVARVDEVERPEGPEPPAVPVQLGIEVDVAGRPALAVPLAGLLDAEGDVAAAGGSSRISSYPIGPPTAVSIE